MSKQKTTTVIDDAEITRGYKFAVENAGRSLEASLHIFESFPDKSLALAQLGQEEVGKSLSLLASAYLGKNEDSWKWFWSGWTNHALKAHRAYLYEIISPLRIELKLSSGKIYDGGPLREKISQEKEDGIYVNFNAKSKKFQSPAENISSEEAFSRISTLIYLYLTANAVMKTLTAKEDTFRFCMFSEIAFRICTEEIYQQDMPGILSEFEARSDEHQSIIIDLKATLSENREFLNTPLNTPI